MATTIQDFELEVRVALHYFEDLLADYGDWPSVIRLLFKFQWLLEACASCFDHTKLWLAATMELPPNHDPDEPYEAGEFQFSKREITFTEIWLLLRLLMVDRVYIERHFASFNPDIDELIIRALRHGLALYHIPEGPTVIDVVYERDNMIWIWHRHVNEDDPVPPEIQQLIDRTTYAPIPRRLQDWLDLHPPCAHRSQ